MSELDTVPAAPAVLKGIAEAHGYKIKTHDFNIDLRDMFDQKLDKTFSEDFVELMNSWTIDTDETHKFCNQIQTFYNYVVDKILETPCRYLGISVFSGYRHKATFDLCQLIKQRAPHIKIVLGGKGLNIRHFMAIEKYLTTAEKMLSFDQIMLKRKLADHIIAGDAEDAIIDLFSGKLNEINFTKQEALNTQLEYPFANFDDARLEKYSGHAGRPQLPVVSSKGCVRDCDFCDVGFHFKNFRSKNGRRMAEEMIFLANKYNIFEFALVDSIANGNMKSLKEACSYLAEYNQSVDCSKRITWAGNWICRPPGTTKPEFFDLLGKSGCISLTVGAEHGSNRVLEIMKKKTTVEGLYYELEQINRVGGIHVILNNITGHWAETYEDFLITVDMFLRLGPYVANGTVVGWIIGPGFHVLDGSPAAGVQHSGIVSNNANFDFMWYSTKNPNLTIKARMARLYFIYKLCFMLNATTFNTGSMLAYIRESLKLTEDKWKDFYDKNLNKDSWSPCQSIGMVDQVKPYVNRRISELYTGTKIKINVTANCYNGSPRMFVKYNNVTYFYNELTPGDNSIEFEVLYNYSNKVQLEIGMDNKDKFDTQIDSCGNILLDKNIKINSLIIDNIDLMIDSTYYYQFGKYVELNGIVSNKKMAPGLFSNQSIIFEFNEPFWVHYLSSRPNTFDYALSNTFANQALLEEIKTMFSKLEY